jgi:hypothetical protein
MPTPYSPGAGQCDALRGHLLAVQRVRQLDQDAGAVAHQLVGTDGAAVVQVLQDLQGVLDDRMRLDAADVGDEADAAGVVLVGGGVQPGLFQVLDFGGSRHGGSFGLTAATDGFPRRLTAKNAV